MRTITAHCKVLSPMFINGLRPDDHEKPPEWSELRVPSIRGVMRFWFRALAAGVTDSLEAIAELETFVFGGVRGDQPRTGVQLSMAEPPSRSRERLRIDDTGAKYLAYGRKPQSREYDRNRLHPSILPSTAFAILLSAPPGFGHAHLQIAADALWTAAALGGIGGRSRRGYGAFAVEGWDIDTELCDVVCLPSLPWCCPTAAEAASTIRKGVADAQERIRNALRRNGHEPGGSQVRISHLSTEWRLLVWKTSWRVSTHPQGTSVGSQFVLHEVGNALCAWREGKVTEYSPPAGPRFHERERESRRIKEWLKAPAGFDTARVTAVRAAFGLPWGMYSGSTQEYFSDDGVPPGEARKMATAKFGVLPEQQNSRAISIAGDEEAGEGGRRASPLVISLFAFSGGEQIGATLTHLTGDFLYEPAGSLGVMQATRRHCPESVTPPVPDANQEIGAFLDYLKGAGGGLELATEAMP